MKTTMVIFSSLTALLGAWYANVRFEHVATEAVIVSVGPISIAANLVTAKCDAAVRTPINLALAGVLMGAILAGFHEETLVLGLLVVAIAAVYTVVSQRHNYPALFVQPLGVAILTYVVMMK